MTASNRFSGSLLALPLALALVCTPTFAQSHRIGPSEINNDWILLNQKVDVDVPNGGRNLDKTGCAAVSFTIGSDGLPRELKVEKMVPVGDFGQIAQSAVSRFRYGPSLTNRERAPTSTYYVVPFNAPSDPAGQQKVMASCQLAGYETR